MVVGLKYFSRCKKHSRTTKDVLPFTFGEELVSNDPTALLETGFEPIGTVRVKTIVVIFFSSKIFHQFFS